MALGPVLGGLLAGGFGWRAIFWFLVAFAGSAIILILLFCPETLRRVAGNGSTPLTSWTQKPILWSLIRKNSSKTDEEAVHPEVLKMIRPAEPFKWVVFLQPYYCLAEFDVACTLLFGACVYTAWSMMIATTTRTLQEHYEFTTIQ